MKHLDIIAARIRAFEEDEAGAVTVDWVALTAAIVFLGAGVAYFIGAGVPALAETLQTYMENVEVGG